MSTSTADRYITLLVTKIVTHIILRVTRVPTFGASLNIYKKGKKNAIISDLLYQNLFKPDQLGKTGGGGGSSVASTRAASRPASGDRDGAPMAKHAVNKSSADGEETSKTRAVSADAQPSALKSTMSEKRADKCKEKCPANIKECCRNAIAGMCPTIINYWLL